MIAPPPSAEDASALAAADVAPAGVEPARGTGPVAESASGAGPAFSAGTAHLLAWLVPALVDAVEIARLIMPRGGLAVRAAHHFYDAGHFLALGLLSSAAIDAWQRWGPGRGGASALRKLACGTACLALLSATLAFVVARPSLVGYAEQLGARWSGAADADAEPWLTLLVLGFSLVVPGAMLAGRLLSRPRLRWVGLIGALGIVIVNERVLEGDYSGGHFYFTWAAAGLAGSCLTGTRLPRGWAGEGRRRAAALRAGLALAALVAATSVSVWPVNAVLLELFRLDGAILTPILARVRGGGDASRWSRPARPSAPPSSPALLPANGIVLLVTVDALRADVLHEPRHARHVPNLLGLRERGVYFSQARSPASSTRLAMAGIFAGRFASQLSWTNPTSGRPRLDQELSPRLPELLRDAGVDTATFVSEFRGLVNATGIVRGFEEETVFVKPDLRHKGDFELCPRVMGTFIDRLERQGDRPLFMFVHLMDPHAPYDAAGEQGTPFEGYLREVALVDAWIGRLAEAVARAGLAHRTALIVGADHGEAFGEHGTTKHGGATLYDELIHVPLLFVVPGIAPRTIEAPVSLIDLGPTILDLMGVATPGFFVGQSLLPFVRGGVRGRDERAFFETYGIRGMMTSQRVKVIIDRRRQREEVYDLVRDPKELDNLSDDDPARAARLEEELGAFFR